MSTSKTGAVAEVQKERSMELQKEMIAAHYDALSEAPETGRKVVYTFVPGNLTELMRAFDVLPVLPEINALQSGMRKLSGDYITEAEKYGHSEDVCTYVKCDIGMLKKGNIGPTGKKLPKPDLLLLSYTGCFTFMKWFELLREEYDCPVAMLHVPYQSEGIIQPHHRDYIVKQLRTEVIPKLEEVTGRRFDEDRLREKLRLSAQAEDDLVWVLESAKNIPSPIDAYFGGVFYIGPMFSAFRGTPEGVDYYHTLRAEVAERLRAGLGPVVPEGQMERERYRLVVEGPPNWTTRGEVWRVDAIVVDSVWYGPEQGCVVVVVKSHRKPGCEPGQARNRPPFGPAVLAPEEIVDRQPVPVARHKIVTHVEGGKSPTQPWIERIYCFSQTGRLVERLAVRIANHELQRFGAVT